MVAKENMGTSRYKMRPHLYYYNPLDGDPSTWPNGTPPKYNPEPVAPAVPEVTEPVTPPEATIPTTSTEMPPV